MRRVLPVAAAWLTLLSATPALAVMIEVVPAVSQVGPGDPVIVRLAISGLGEGVSPSLSTFDLDVASDPSVLAFTVASFGDPTLGDQLDLLGLGSTSAATPSAGTVNLFELSLDTPDDLDSLQAGAFVLVTLTFAALAGESALTLTVNALGDADGGPLEADLVAGRVIVRSDGPVPVPVPVAPLLLALGLILLAARRAVWRPRAWGRTLDQSGYGAR